MSKLARAPEAPTAGSASASSVPDWMKNYTTVTTASPDSLTNLRKQAEKLRDKIVEAKDLEARLTEVNKEIEAFKFRTLPELLEKAEVPSIETLPNGNQPGYKFKLADYYYANIKADWSPEQRALGFGVVRKLGGEAIIRNTLEIRFGPGTDALVQRIVKGIQRVIQENPEADISLEPPHEKVPHNTLAAWLREYVETTGEEPTREQLEALNAKISKQVKVEEVKPKLKPPRR